MEVSAEAGFIEPVVIRAGKQGGEENGIAFAFADLFPFRRQAGEIVIGSVQIVAANQLIERRVIATAITAKEFFVDNNRHEKTSPL